MGDRAQESERPLATEFVVLWQGYLVSQVGNQALTIVVLYWALDTTGSATMMSLLTATSVVSAIVFGPIAGALVDNVSRTRVLVVSDMLRAAAVGLLAVAMSRLAARDVLPVMFLAMAVNGAAAAFAEPAAAAVIASTIRHTQLNVANSMWQVTRQVSVIVGQAFGGLAYRTLGGSVLLAVDAATFVYSAISAFVAGRLGGFERFGEAVSAAGFWRTFVDGFQYGRNRPGLLPFLTGVSMFNAAIAPVVVLLPLYVTQWLGQGVAWYGFLLASLTGGAVCGSLAAARSRATGTRRAWLLVGAFLGVGLCLVAVSVIRNRWMVSAVLAAAGAMSGAVNVMVATFLQATTPDRYRGRVLSLHATGSRALGPIGMLLGGVLGDLTGGNAPIVYAACGGSAVVIAAALARSTQARSFLATDRTNH